MRRAYVALRESPHYRREIFAAGLGAHGYRVTFESTPPHGPDDVLVIWNRYGRDHELASRYEAIGARVLVAENAYLGNSFAGSHWYAISRNHHNGAGTWTDGGPERWDNLAIVPRAWRAQGSEIVVLMQRGIGEPGVAMPRHWRAPGRIRRHPGRNVAPSLESDLRNARACITWGSGAALKALLLGIPVYHALPQWIGAPAARFYQRDLPTPYTGDPLPMFRRLVWAQWRRSEIQSGEAFDWLLK